MGEGKILEILDPSTIAFLLLAGFIAAFIDSTVGGGRFNFLRRHYWP